MKRLLLLAILLFSTQASAAIAFSVGGGCGAFPGGECTVTLAIPNNGTVVVSIASKATSQSVVRLVDTASNNYNLLKTLTSGAVNQWVYLAYNTASASSLTVTLAQGGLDVMVAAYTGVSSIGQVVTNTGSSTTPSINLTTTDSNNWLVAPITSAGAPSVTDTPTAGTKRVTGTMPGWSYDNTVASPGSLTCSLTMSVTDTWAVVGIELRTVNPSQAAANSTSQGATPLVFVPSGQ